MIWLVDDQHLSEVLRTGRRPFGVRKTDEIVTTGCWYVRLCRAVLGAADRSGVLSEPFAALPVEQHEAALAALLELPSDIGLVSLRHLAPVMASLRTHDLNLLSSEALAASVHLDARVLLSVHSPRLETALAHQRRQCVVRST